MCLNVNFPKKGEKDGFRTVNGDYRGVRICRMAYGSWNNEITVCHHPRGYDYYWMVGHYADNEPEAQDTDSWALDHGYVAITPTRIDVTAYEAFDGLQQLLTLNP